VEPDLRKQFDLAVSADPGADSGEMARFAMLQGGRIRHRRRLAVAGLAAGVVAMIVTVSAVDLLDGAAPPAAPPAGPPVMVAAGMRLPAPDCSANPVTADATDAIIYLNATDRQQSAIGEALNDDKRVVSVIFESREEAYARFLVLWKDSPDFVASVTPESLPSSYRLRLHDRAQFTTFSREYAKKPGVREIIGRVCPERAPVGGVQ
jgi:hypothetical protein